MFHRCNEKLHALQKECQTGISQVSKYHGCHRFGFQYDLGSNWDLKNIKFIPGLKRMLVSVIQLNNKCYHVMFGDQIWKVKNGTYLLLKVTN